jgi:beta-phosphoglucomutase
MLQAVIFDFDGVITDSEILHLRSFNEILAQFGVELATKDYYKTYLGLSDIDCFNLLIDQGHLKMERTRIPDLVRQKDVIFKNLAATEGRIFDGVRDFLRMLAEKNITVAICSGALLCEIELILEEANLRSHFEAIVSAEQVRKGKPHPEGFLLTLERLNERRSDPIIAGRCVVIEDSHWGIEAAKAAGMHTVAVTNTYDADRLAAAEKIVPSLGNLTFDDLQQICD